MATMAEEPKKNKSNRESSYIGLGIALGLSIGYMFGLVVLENSAIGASLGLMMGILLGSIADEQAARKRKDEE